MVAHEEVVVRLGEGRAVGAAQGDVAVLQVDAREEEVLVDEVAAIVGEGVRVIARGHSSGGNRERFCGNGVLRPELAPVHVVEIVGAAASGKLYGARALVQVVAHGRNATIYIRRVICKIRTHHITSIAKLSFGSCFQIPTLRQKQYYEKKWHENKYYG